MKPLLAGPALLSACCSNPETWALAVSYWLSSGHTFRLEFVATPDAWVRSLGDGCAPTHEHIAGMYAAIGRASTAKIAIVAFQKLQQLVRSRESGCLVEDSWTSTGCLATHPCRATSEGVAEMLVANSGGSVAGMPTSETEVLSASQLVEDENNALVSVDREVVFECLSDVAPYLQGLDLADFRDHPTAGLRVASAQSDYAGAGRPQCGFACLEPLKASLRGLESNVVRLVFKAMASLVMPVDLRLPSLNERHLRRSESPSSKPRESEYGTAYRATVSDAGPGWRLHYWRAGPQVIFANVTTKSGTSISLGRIEGETWPN